MDLAILIENIRKLCMQKGLKPTNACIESGVGKSFISSMSRGQVPSVEKVKLLADYLGVTTSELLGETLPTPAETTAVDGAADEIAALIAAGHDHQKISQAQESISLLSQLNPEFQQRAKDHLEYLLAKQAEEEKKNKDKK